MEKKYCEIQEYCKLLIQANAQYDAVVKQNRSLQSELRFANDNNKKDEEYIRKLEEKNMLLEKENENLKTKCIEMIKSICSHCGWENTSSCDCSCEHKQFLNNFEVNNGESK